MALHAIVRDRDGKWNVPNANWNESEWNRNANWLTNDWNSNYRVVLLDTQLKVSAEQEPRVRTARRLFFQYSFSIHRACVPFLLPSERAR